MAYSDVTPGDIDNGTVNVIIEIRKNERNKYEFDKDTGRLMLDRVNGPARCTAYH
jgi:inorganic pyrophosphatase